VLVGERIHAGVLEALSAAGLHADFVTGTSVGSACAALHAQGKTPAEVADSLDRCGQVLFRPTLPRRGFLSNRGLRHYLESMGPDVTFEDMQIPLAVVSADIDHQQEVVLRNGLVWMCVLASISIPGVFPAVSIGGRTLVDGGILNPVPASTAAGMGAGGVVAVRLGSPAQTPVDDMVVSEQGLARTNALNVIMRSIEIMQGRIAGDVPDTPLITLAPEFPELPGAKLRHFSAGRRYIESGAASAEEALPRLQTIFPWLRPL